MIRSVVMACLAALPCAGVTQDTSMGAKKEPLSHLGASSPVGILPTLQMVMALGLVVVLVKWALPGLMAKFGKRMVTKIDSPIRVEETASFGGGSLYVVSVRGRTLLLSSGQNGASFLADLTVKPKDEPSFMEMVEESPGTADRAVIETEMPDVVDATLALDRLERLVG